MAHEITDPLAPETCRWLIPLPPQDTQKYFDALQEKAGMVPRMCLQPMPLTWTSPERVLPRCIQRLDAGARRKACLSSSASNESTVRRLVVTKSYYYFTERSGRPMRRAVRQLIGTTRSLVRSSRDERRPSAGFGTAAPEMPGDAGGAPNMLTVCSGQQQMPSATAQSAAGLWRFGPDQSVDMLAIVYTGVPSDHGNANPRRQRAGRE